MTLIIGLLVFLFIVWFMLAQPTFTSQSTKTKVENVKAENLKKYVYTIVQKSSIVMIMKK